MSEPAPKRVDLAGRLSGYYVMVDVDQIDCGLLEDLESKNVGTILDAMARLVVGGDLPHGTDRAGLRRLTPHQIAEVIKVIPALFDLPKPA